MITVTVLSTSASMRLQAATIAKCEEIQGNCCAHCSLSACDTPCNEPGRTPCCDVAEVPCPVDVDAPTCPSVRPCIGCVGAVHCDHVETTARGRCVGEIRRLSMSSPGVATDLAQRVRGVDARLRRGLQMTDHRRNDRSAIHCSKFANSVIGTTSRAISMTMRRQ